MTERRRPRPITAGSLRRPPQRVARAATREPAQSRDQRATFRNAISASSKSGRTLPSRDMVIRLCDALDIPLRARNELSDGRRLRRALSRTVAGHLEMAGVREALNRIINHHEPYPAFVVDRQWRIVMSNGGARASYRHASTATLHSLSPDGALNFMRMMFEPTQMRPRIRNWQSVGSRLLARLRSEARGDPYSPSAAAAEAIGASADRTDRRRARPQRASDRAAGN